MSKENILFLIPARGGSKGLPGKNIGELNGQPLISYSLNLARSLAKEEDICVSTDDQEIVAVLDTLSYQVPFIRPDELATDNAGSYEVILHAINYYSDQGRDYDSVVLLQPTSPLRLRQHVEKAIGIYQSDNVDAVYAVKITEANPTYVLYEEEEGYLCKYSRDNFVRRQQIPEIYQVNGAVYVFSCEALRRSGSLSELNRIKKYLMPKQHSYDIDDVVDWQICDYLLREKIVLLDY